MVARVSTLDAASLSFQEILRRMFRSRSTVLLYLDGEKKFKHVFTSTK
jgi:hypothetical protein